MRAPDPCPTPTKHGLNDHRRRWLILLVVGLVELMVVLDATIVNIALPSAQRELGFSDDVRQWVITAYALAFGSLLMLGGRIGDLFGRRRVLVIGLVGFAAASALGGLASGFGLLVVARALQGVFGALLAPATLAIVAVTFADSPERDKAFGIYAALAGIGAGVGLLVGGALTDLLSWRWCLLVNLVIALPTAAVAVSVIRADHRDRAAGGHRRMLDLPGLTTVTLGLFALVYGFSSAERDGWGATVTIVALGVAPVLLAVFVLIERRVREPLLPLRIVLHPMRAGSYFALAVLGIGMFGVFLFLTYYLQQQLGQSPIEAGLSFMPMNLTILAVSALTSSMLVTRIGARVLIVVGLLFAAAGMAYLTQIDSGSGYADGVLPGLIMFGIGAGLLYVTTYAGGTAGVEEGDTGVASAVLNTTSQVGGSIGTALLSTLFGTAVAGYVRDDGGPGVAADAALHGYVTVFWWAAALTFAGALITAVVTSTGGGMVRERREMVRE